MFKKILYFVIYYATFVCLILFLQRSLFFNQDSLFSSHDNSRHLFHSIFVIREFSDFNLPSWNPFRNLGYPVSPIHLSTGCYNVFYVIDAIIINVFRLFSINPKFIFLFVHYFIVLFIWTMGYYLLLNLITQSGIAIFLGMFAAIFSGYGLFITMHYDGLELCSFFPWLIFTTMYLFINMRTLKFKAYIILAGFIFGITLFTAGTGGIIPGMPVFIFFIASLLVTAFINSRISDISKLKIIFSIRHLPYLVISAILVGMLLSPMIYMVIFQKGSFLLSKNLNWPLTHYIGFLTHNDDVRNTLFNIFIGDCHHMPFMLIGPMVLVVTMIGIIFSKNQFKLPFIITFLLTFLWYWNPFPDKLNCLFLLEHKLNPLSNAIRWPITTFTFAFMFLPPLASMGVNVLFEGIAFNTIERKKLFFLLCIIIVFTVLLEVLVKYIIILGIVCLLSYIIIKNKSWNKIAKIALGFVIVIGCCIDILHINSRSLCSNWINTSLVKSIYSKNMLNSFFYTNNNVDRAVERKLSLASMINKFPLFYNSRGIKEGTNYLNNEEYEDTSYFQTPDIMTIPIVTERNLLTNYSKKIRENFSLFEQYKKFNFRLVPVTKAILVNEENCTNTLNKIIIDDNMFSFITVNNKNVNCENIITPEEYNRNSKNIKSVYEDRVKKMPSEFILGIVYKQEQIKYEKNSIDNKYVIYSLQLPKGFPNYFSTSIFTDDSALVSLIISDANRVNKRLQPIQKDLSAPLQFDVNNIKKNKIMFSLSKEDTEILRNGYVEFKFFDLCRAFDMNIEYHSSDEVILNTHFPQHTFLLYHTLYDKRWKATINGKVVNVLNANLGFISIPVPPGQHQVHIYYDAFWQEFLLITNYIITIIFLPVTVLYYWYKMFGYDSLKIRQKPKD